MTAEQIKQNAEEYIEQKFPTNRLWERRNEYDAFITGAHSRDEEVAILTQKYSDAVCLTGSMKDEIKELNGKLAVKNIELMDALAKQALLQTELDQLRNPWIIVEDGLPPLDETRDIDEEMAYPNLSIEVVLSDGNRVIGGIYNYGRKDWSYDFPMLESFAPKFWMPILQPKGGKK